MSLEPRPSTLPTALYSSPCSSTLECNPDIAYRCALPRAGWGGGGCCRDRFVLPLVDGQVSRCHLSSLVVLSCEYRIAVQGGSAYGEVGDTRLDEWHLTRGDLLVVPSTCRHHGMPPPQMGCHAKVSFLLHGHRTSNLPHSQECNPSRPCAGAGSKRIHADSRSTLCANPAPSVVAEEGC